MTLVLSGAAVLTMDAGDRFLDAADLHIDGTDIIAITPPGSERAAEAEVIDCSDALVVPGFVNAHTHCCAGILRGVAEDKPRSFWSEYYTLPRQDRLGVEDYVFAAGIACHELLLHGVTCIADRFGYMDRIGVAIEQSGIRAVLGPTLTEGQGPADWRTSDAVFERWGASPAARISAGIAPHAPNTCSDALLRRCAGAAERLGSRVFVHLAQNEAEVAQLRARGYSGALASLLENGLTGPHVVAAHCLYLEEAEIEAWPRHQISIAHCPGSNIKIEGRTIQLSRFAGKVAIGIGTDWAASDNAMDVLAETRLAALVGKLKADDPAALPVTSMLRMATIEGARALGLDRVVGSIETGKRADLVVLDLKRLSANPRHDLAANLLYSMGPHCVRDVIVDGAVLVRDGKLMRANEAELARQLDRRKP
ncbi:MAG: amidohydrolase family protein [Proteobacteria bacterium]|nr:amidohydrolase family protein [Pseudomonadota bacterium]MBI3497911.1 amidohydrolase family protein [Pseudomonadota bacterium]